jgi:hypothetical protein
MASRFSQQTLDAEGVSVVFSSTFVFEALT